MKINVLLFAGVAEAVGKRDLRLELPEKTTVHTLIDRLATEYPDAADLIRHSVIALNQDYAEADQVIRPGDEIALIPPVSGGEERQPAPLLFITEEALSADRLIREVSNPWAGAVLTFAGIVREYTHGQKTVALEYEAYAPMALRKMEEIVGEIRQRWPEVRVAMGHRTGKLAIGEISVLIAVASPHRGESFAAGHYAIERLKETVPIWKKEIWADGSQWKGPQTGPWDPRQKRSPAPPLGTDT
ncbi:molybdopterin converting factor subunit 1 [Kroppenstedtia eburnea]|uniref:Molybdopterin synthase catalytic subunit n=1 Tax=Kroppenstedtia eburnea TaxID=714067 RepID=A0A1N7P3R6_9BACL|nr:molybdopterin converting factor subunit 1 [Kroppenstedtia eburnea]QKI80864.1 molybdopterin converting factor subunit 1 [Kroppenstedtia eburnea]SIT05275.1 molybdopterin synthase catalytic subunit [Kroppenstedtia eburnea]